LSSVYAFYDPKLSAKIELGKYTALREIEWVQRAKWITNRYYYLGYYIHSCQKMIYKAEYKPSELLCPVNFKWVDFEVAKSRLQQKSPTRHCCALYEDDASDGCGESRPYIENVVLEIGDGGFRGGTPSLLTVSMLTRDGRRMIDSVITEYVNEVGTEIARKLIVKLS
jgi:arginine-tRNA-protein transferase